MTDNAHRSFSSGQSDSYVNVRIAPFRPSVAVAARVGAPAAPVATAALAGAPS